MAYAHSRESTGDMSVTSKDAVFPHPESAHKPNPVSPSEKPSQPIPDFCLTRKFHAMRSLTTLTLTHIKLLQRFLGSLSYAHGFPVVVYHKDFFPITESRFDSTFSNQKSRNASFLLTKVLHSKIANTNYLAAVMPNRNWRLVKRDSVSRISPAPAIGTLWEVNNALNQLALSRKKLHVLGSAIIAAKNTGNINKLSDVYKNVPLKKNDCVKTTSIDTSKTQRANPDKNSSSSSSVVVAPLPSTLEQRFRVATASIKPTRAEEPMLDDEYYQQQLSVAEEEYHLVHGHCTLTPHKPSTLLERLFSSRR